MAEKEKKVVEAENKQNKPAKEKKKGKMKAAWKGFKSELKKIVWPSWKQVLKNTLVVLTVVISFAIVIGALDYAFSSGITGLTQLFT